jgi:peptidoglycan/LPS O-acetylase OafA/YrhL
LRGKSKLAERTSVHLDLIRGLAALAVMVGHVRGLFFKDFGDLVHPTIWDRVTYGFTGFGHQAVIVFFVLSGYFIGSSVSESVNARRWSWRVYLVNRLTRLEVVLLPALLLGAVWDQIGLRLPQAASLYYGGLYKYFNPSVSLRSTFPVFFGNLFFLQGVASPVFGSNGPLWSLSYEFWYYLLFPAVMLAAAAWVGHRSRFLYLGLALLMLWFVGPTISLYFLIWIAGAVVGRLHRWEWLQTSRILAPATAFGGLLFVVPLAWNRIRPIFPEALGDFLIGLGFALWLYVLLQGRRADVAPAYAKVARTLSRFSYTLYLTHFPVLLLLRGWLSPQGNWQPDLRHGCYAMGLALLMLIYAYGVAEFTEARTTALRRRLLHPWMQPAKEAAQ